ncbi:putative proton-dependent oligopeptide transporter family, MFS transporter superfamily [Dioscorea sansibarensis]
MSCSREQEMERRREEEGGEMKMNININGEFGGEEEEEEDEDEYTLDGSVDIRGNPASKTKTGGWIAASLVLVNQGLATLAFFGVNVNLVLFLTRVLQQNNADAANNVSKWTGTVYIFSLVGAFLSDSYWGRYKTCAIFQSIFVLGLVLLSLSSYLFLLKPTGCGGEDSACGPHSGVELGLFYLSIYMTALGNGGYQPNIATFGADQFDEENPKESHSKVSFFSYFYLALNLGSLFSNTVLSYFENEGSWALGFWASAVSAFIALVLFLGGTPRYRYFKPGGNPLSRVAQVVVAAARKWKVEMAPSTTNDENLYETDVKEFSSSNTGIRKMLHTEGFRFLDKAAYIDDEEEEEDMKKKKKKRNPWRLCTITQVEEVKCILRLLPIWLCTIIYSVVFTQMASLFVEQGAAMSTKIFSFTIPPASMSAFDILSVSFFIFLYRRVLHPLFSNLRNDPKGLTELHRMGIGLIIAVTAMIASGTVEHYRLKNKGHLSILYQIPQYVLIGASEVFMYVGQLEFFNSQAPDGLKSFGSALCMTSMSLGNYFSSLLVSLVMDITAGHRHPGWIPADLNNGNLDRFYFLLAAMTSVDFVVYVACAKWYKCIKLEPKSSQYQDDDEDEDEYENESEGGIVTGV